MWKNALLALASLLLTCLMAEAALRVLRLAPGEYIAFDRAAFTRTHQPGTVTRWSGMPGFVKDFENVVTTNSIGFYDTEHSKTKNSRRRLLLLGDSFVEAHQVPLEKTFFKRLEASAGVECISMGRAGNGSIQELADLESKGLDFSPDLVLVFIHDGNDFSDDFFQMHPSTRPAARGKPDEDLHLYDSWVLLKNSWFNRWMAFLVTEIHKKPREDRRRIESFKRDQSLAIHAQPGTPFFKDSEKAWDAAYRATEKNYLRMKQRCDARGVRFAAVFVDNPFTYEKKRAEDLYRLLPELHGHLDFKRPVKRLKETFDKEGIAYLDLDDLFAEHYRRTGHLGHFPHDFHWDEEGHAIVAPAVEEFLK